MCHSRRARWFSAIFYNQRVRYARAFRRAHRLDGADRAEKMIPEVVCLENRLKLEVVPIFT